MRHAFLVFLFSTTNLSHSQIFIPAGGNAWVSDGTDKLTEKGIVNWSDSRTKCKIYTFVQPGSFDVSLVMKVGAKTTMSVLVDEKEISVTVMPGMDTTHVGTWKYVEKRGFYLCFTVSGVQRSGANFGDFFGLLLKGSATTRDVAFVHNNEGNFFYWGRRGPSVHLRYDMEGRTDMEWFYSEITVPAGSDVIGSYYMANGFSDGYFGCQVNSESERRILFSVWSPFKTDDPKAIPEEDKIILVKKGEGVYTGEFGNEGSGGQSYLRYPWKAGSTYGFLLRARPDGTNTVYTAWFFAAEESQWKLVASWRRPKKSAYLSALYSFLENFIPETGNVERRAHYGNQWICDSAGNWTELTRAKFTGDNTARKNYRKDYGGGVSGESFFLRNCGFFSDFTTLDQPFERKPKGRPPAIDFSKLP